MVRESRRRKPAAAPATQRVVRLNASIPHDVHCRLAVHSLMSGKTQADILADLITTHLREYRIQSLAKTAGQGVEESSAADVELIGAVAA